MHQGKDRVNIRGPVWLPRKLTGERSRGSTDITALGYLIARPGKIGTHITRNFNRLFSSPRANQSLHGYRDLSETRGKDRIVRAILGCKTMGGVRIASLPPRQKPFHGRSQEFNRKLGTGKPHVRFNEQGVETDQRQNERETDGGKTRILATPRVRNYS